MQDVTLNNKPKFTNNELRFIPVSQLGFVT